MALGGGSGGGSAKGVRMGGAYVELTAKDSITAALKKVGQRFAAFGKMALAVTGIGGVIGSVLGGLSFKETVDDLSKMNDVAKAFGVNGTRISGLLGVLGAVGGEFKENLEGVIQFSGNVTRALNGIGQGVELFDGLSVVAEDIAKLPIDEQFYSVLGAIRELPQPLQEGKLALLGGSDSLKQWQRLLSMSNDEVRQMAKDLAFSSAELQDAANASRAMERLGASVKRIWQQIAIMLAPFVADIANKIADALKPVQEWMKGRTIADLWDMVKAGFSAAMSWIDIQAKMLFVNVANYFSEQFNLAVLAAKSAVADLGVAIHKALTAALAGPGRMLAGMLDGINPQAASAIRLANMAMAGGGPDAEAEKIAAKRDFLVMEEARRKVLGDMMGKLNADLVGVAANLVTEFARVEQNRRNRLADPERPALVAAQQKIAAMVGTFGAGSFLTQAFGSRQKDFAKRMVDEQQKANEILAKIEANMRLAGGLVWGV